ncbi:MAG: hypothetical protein QXU18_00795 [Thermoplasmatales archaeon]
MAIHEGKNEKKIIDIIPEKIRSLYCGDPLISDFPGFMKKNRKETLLYLEIQWWRRPRHSGTTPLYPVMAVQAPVQDKRRLAQ